MADENAIEGLEGLAHSLGSSRGLAKATDDPFEYALGLRDGTVIVFESADVVGEWAQLRTINDELSTLPLPCPRGVEVRLADIIWTADAPQGS